MKVNEILRNEDDRLVFLPPYVVNDANPVLPNAETIDWSILSLKIPQIHSEFKLTGKGVKVAIIDTGVHADHEDLKGKVIETHNTTSEAYGWTNGHGTGVAALVGASKNTTGILSVAPDCQIIAIKALTESGSGSMVDIVEAVNLAIDRGAHVINMSLGGGGGFAPLEAAINRAAAAGIYVISSAGNSGADNSVGYPGKYPNGYAIAATNQAGKVSAFSSRGPEVDIAAPGERVLTAWKNGGYATVSGTSFSSPIVAGCFALFVQAKIKVTLEMLKSTAIDIEEPGFDHKAGYGLINPYELIKKYATMEEPVIKCPAPTNFRVSNIGQTDALAEWDASQGAFNYVVQIRKQGENDWKQVNITRITSMPVSNLTQNTDYELRIHAACSNGVSAWVSSNFKTAAAVVQCTVPNNFRAIDVKANYIVLSWDSNPNAKSYKIDGKESSNGTWNTWFSNITATTATIDGLKSNTSYDVRIQSNCEGSSSPVLTFQFKTPETAVDVTRLREVSQEITSALNKLNSLISSIK